MATTNQNLTAKQLTTWKNSVDTAIKKNLVSSLQKAYNDAVQLHKITSSGQDDNNLSYRFNDLSAVTDQAAKQLTTFMNTFDTDLTSYINTISNSSNKTSDDIKKSIDQFKESSDKITKLKM